jgi:hypothetical protein
LELQFSISSWTVFSRKIEGTKIELTSPKMLNTPTSVSWGWGV